MYDGHMNMTREQAQQLDPQLTHCLNTSNSFLHSEHFGEAELAQVRVHLGLAIGLTAAFTPDNGGTGFSYALMLASTRDQEELVSLQRVIFDSAFSLLNAAYHA